MLCQIWKPLVGVLFGLSMLQLSGCASVPSELRNEKEITVVYRQNALPVGVHLITGAGVSLGLVGAAIDEATKEKNEANQARFAAINSPENREQLFALFKKSFAEALKIRGLPSIEVPSLGGERLDARTHIPSFDRKSITTRWVIQIDEVVIRYNASSMFSNYQPWVWIKFALFDMEDNALTPIVPLTPANFGNEKYHYKNADALAAARTAELLTGLQLTVKAAALDTSQRVRP
ncbi:MAG: hypothetical protein ACK41V_01555 [Acidovorax sp.]|uniref:hypothetical protein n=1 Tax=Acidovorax sp. TaxID=1872122 RepID=UPI00391C5A98